MDLVTLQAIVNEANLRAIKKALKAAGFADCRRDRKLRRASLYDIATAPYEKTAYISDGKGNEYSGELCRDVKGYESYEFVLIQQLSPYRRGGEDLSTKRLLIYSKKLEHI